MTDVPLRRALARIDAWYVEPERIDTGRMLERALHCIRRSGFTPPPLPAAPAGDRLVERLAPPLETVLASTQDRSSRDRLRAGLLDGALRTLDPYSKAVTGRSRRRLLERFTGRACGIGVRLGRRQGCIRILRSYPGSPASAAGLAAGDVLTSIDGESLEGLLVSQALDRIRGEPGTAVAIGVARLANPVSIERRPIASPHVFGRMLEERVAWVRIERLSKNTPSQFDRTLAALTRVAEVAALVLDLRGNKGGSMLAAAAVADRFVGSGTLVEAVDRHGRPVPGLIHRVVAAAGDRPDWPVVVVVDGATSSAAELLAAALAWNGRAPLVGRRTFGKTTVMKLYRLDEGQLILRLAVAYMKAAGRRLSEQGLEPELSVASPGPRGAAGDPALEAAVQYLQKKLR